MSYDLLDETKVVELSLYAFAPSAAAVLSDWGADVIKVVPPRVADPMMGTPIAGLPRKDVGVAFMWELLNRGKRCVGIDVSTVEGREVLFDLVSGADVFISNLLPGARQRFGIEPSDFQTRHPSLVYARASAHGVEGPESGVGGYDHTDYWARSGIGHAASQVADEFVPQPGPAMGDLVAGVALAGAIVAALLRRERTGRGAIVDVSLLSTAIWVGAPAAMASLLYDVDTIPRMRHADLPNPLVAAYATRDGRLIYLAGIQTENHFENFCACVDRADLLADPRFVTGAARFKHRVELIAALDELFASRDLAEWVQRLRDLKTPWTVVQTAREAAVDPQVTANHLITTVQGAVEYPVVASPAQFDGLPLRLRPAPDHGEHTDEVLAELGRSSEEIIDLKVCDAVL
jgi:crotonobetainyl-CoA:carnitine CoA-transferase CaiB-like acyl-CoA transferase